MTTERLTQCARAVLDAWSDAGWNVGFDAAMRAMREELAAHEALAAAPAEPVAWMLPGEVVALIGNTHCVSSAAVQDVAKAIWTHTHPAPQPQQAGLSPQQEPKYTVNGHAIVNRASGEEIPADEPVFVFRARDKYAASIIGDYASTFCADPEHRAAVEERFIQFGEWAEKHPGRMKEPDTAATPPQPTAPAAQPEPLHLGACITDGKLHATVMRREANGYIAVVAAAEIDEVSLRAGDCHALMTAPAQQAQAVSQWLPIESAPKNGTEILVWWAHPTKDQPGVGLSHWLDNGKTATPWAGWALPKVIVPGMYVSHWMHKPGCPASAAQKEQTT